MLSGQFFKFNELVGVFVYFFNVLVVLFVIMDMFGLFGIVVGLLDINIIIEPDDGLLVVMNIKLESIVFGIGVGLSGVDE